MKHLNRARLASTLMVGALLGLGSMAANAATNTPANTSISNTATVNYSVGGTGQTPITSNVSTFVVDAKLVLTVAKVGTIVNVAPGQGGVVLVYQVTNSGNDTRGVSFSQLQVATGAADPFGGAKTDTFNTIGPQIFVSKTNSQTYVSSTDTATSIPQLAPGVSSYVFVVSNIPADRVNGDLAAIALKAQVMNPGAVATYGTAPGTASVDQSTQAWTPGTVQTIFADAGGVDDAAFDGYATDRSAYLVASSALSITKTSAVLSDPTNLTPSAGHPAHAIPGATVQYTITVANASTASANATSIAINDDLSAILPANVTWVANSIKLTPSGGAGNASGSCADAGTSPPQGTAAPYNSTAVTCLYNTTGGLHAVQVGGLTLAPSDTMVITFNVTIN